MRLPCGVPAPGRAPPRRGAFPAAGLARATSALASLARPRPADLAGPGPGNAHLAGGDEEDNEMLKGIQVRDQEHRKLVLMTPDNHPRASPILFYRHGAVSVWESTGMSRSAGACGKSPGGVSGVSRYPGWNTD